MSKPRSGKCVKLPPATVTPTTVAPAVRKALPARMDKTAWPANPAMLVYPAYLATIHQSHCRPMADADGAHPDHPAHPAPLDPLDPLARKEALDPLAALAKMAALAQPDPLVKLDLPAETDIPDLQATKEATPLQAAKETMAVPVQLAAPAQPVPMAIVARLAKLAVLAVQAQLVVPAVQEMQAKKEPTVPLVQLAVPAQMPNIVHAPIVRRNIKQQPMATSVCRPTCTVFD